MNMCYLFIYLPNNYTTKVLRSHVLKTSKCQIVLKLFGI